MIMLYIREHTNIPIPTYPRLGPHRGKAAAAIGPFSIMTLGPIPASISPAVRSTCRHDWKHNAVLHAMMETLPGVSLSPATASPS